MALRTEMGDFGAQMGVGWRLKYVGLGVDLAVEMEVEVGAFGC